MKLTKDNLRIFGLNTTEVKILNTLLEKGLMTVSDLGRKAKINRTTVYPALLRLKKRGIVRRVTKGTHKKWKVVRISKIKELAYEGLCYMRSKKEPKLISEIVKGINTKEVGISVYRGKRQVEKAYEAMLDLSKTERVYAIQGNKSAKLALEKLDKQYFFDFHEKFKKAHIIMEGINGELVLSLFKKLNIKELQSHKDRMLISVILSDKYMDFGIDVLIFRDTVLLIDMKDEIVVFIKNKAMREMFRCLFALMQDSGKHFDVNAYIQKIIEE